MGIRLPKRRLLLLPCILVAITAAVLCLRLTLRSSLRPEPRVRELEMREKLVTALKKETVLQAIENLPNFDDTLWVGGTLESFPETYEYTRVFIPRLNRVRKILEEGRKDVGVAPLLKNKLAEAVKGFKEASKAANDELAKEGYLVAKAPCGPMTAA